MLKKGLKKKMTVLVCVLWEREGGSDDEGGWENRSYAF